MNRLYRSVKDRKIAGICGGLGDFFSIDPTLIRLVVVFLSLATGLFPGIFTYVVAWIIIPEKPSGAK